MNKCFKQLATYVRLYDGYNKPEIDFQNTYKLFPDFEFIPANNFGQYFNFGMAYEHKDMSMIVKYDKYVCYLTYKIYMDSKENTAYIS